MVDILEVKYLYHVKWSLDDGEYVATCDQYPSLSHLAPTVPEALEGIKALVRDVDEERRQNDTLFDLTNTV